MTAVHLFDALAAPKASDASRDENNAAGNLAQLAEKLVAASLDDLRRIREYEQQFVLGSQRPPEADLAVRRSAWDMFAAWADDAEQVLARVTSVVRNGVLVTRADQLDDAIGRIRARLTVTPEQVVRAREQARQGQFVPAKELRDELHARRRA